MRFTTGPIAARRIEAKRDPFTFFAVLVGATIVGGVVSSALTSQSTPKIPEPPKVEPVTPMPTADDEDMRLAKRRSLAEQSRRRGRSSTILTDPTLNDQPLGG